MIGIYKITNTINNKVYIGQSINIKYRWSEHIRDSQKSDKEKPNAIYKAIRKYGLENFTFEVIEECVQELLNEREQYWIRFYDSYNNGYNMTWGGDAGALYDYVYLVEQYKKYKTIEKTAQVCGCQSHTVSKALKAFNITPNAISSGHKRPIKKIDPETLEVLAVYESMSEAEKSLGRKRAAAISFCLSGKQDTAYGYIWKDIDFDVNQLQPLTNKKKFHSRQKLEEYDLVTGEIINTFNSVKEANLFYNKSLKNGEIYKVCKGKQKSYLKHGWRFVDLE